MDHSSDYYNGLANKNLNKSTRLKKAATAAGEQIDSVDQYRKKVKQVMKLKSKGWKGASAKMFEGYADDTINALSKFREQMDKVRDGFNTEAAAAYTSYIYFDGLYQKAKAEIQNITN